MDMILMTLAAPVAVFLCAVVVGVIFCRHRLGEYLVNLLIAFDQGINTLCGGSPDETISSACYRFGARAGLGGPRQEQEEARLPPKSRLWRLAYRGVNLLFFWQADHCRGAYNSERDRKHLPESMQGKEGGG